MQPHTVPTGVLDALRIYASWTSLVLDAELAKLLWFAASLAGRCSRILAARSVCSEEDIVGDTSQLRR